jgi:hypothetical protein
MSKLLLCALVALAALPGLMANQAHLTGSYMTVQVCACPFWLRVVSPFVLLARTRGFCGCVLIGSQFPLYDIGSQFPLFDWHRFCARSA